ncbi:hypothetical protein D3C81_384530 [compost metagenome]
MKGQLMFRKTSHTNSKGKKVIVVIGIITEEEGDNIQDGFKYDVLDILVNNGKDFTEMNNKLSPEDLLESKIWKV